MIEAATDGESSRETVRVSMTHYEDLVSCDYFGSTESPLLAVGWLHPDYSFHTGRAPSAHVDLLAGLLANAWQPFAMAGRHACEFCAFTGGPATVRINDVVVPVGATNVFVPTEAHVYVAPSLVLHYIDAHQYAPPDPFQEAVSACPPMRSMEYLRAIRKHGLDRLVLKGT